MRGSRSSVAAIALALVAAACLPRPAAAACIGPNASWAYQGETVVITREVSGNDGCHFQFRSGGAGIFESSAIVTKPAHGVFGKTTVYDFAYLPKAGYVGADTATAKICGTWYGSKGCSTLQFQFTVR